MHTDLTNLTEWVRGTISASGCTGPGKFSIGKTTPEKKKIGDIKPVKQKGSVKPLSYRFLSLILMAFVGVRSTVKVELLSLDEKVLSATNSLNLSSALLRWDSTRFFYVPTTVCKVHFKFYTFRSE